MKKFAPFILIASLTLGLSMPQVVLAKKLDERPTPITMVADALFVRPILLGTTLVGTGLYVLTLPITLVGGNADEVGEKFVVKPFKATFVRCLGCTRKHLDGADDYYDR